MLMLKLWQKDSLLMSSSSMDYLYQALCIVSDRDSKFISKFWQSLFNVLGTKLKMATARHQQIDGQSENVVGVVKSLITVVRPCATCYI
jgi:transposase InsO family protein